MQLGYVWMELAVENWKLLFQRRSFTPGKVSGAKCPPALCSLWGGPAWFAPAALCCFPKSDQILWDLPGCWMRKEEMERLKTHPVTRWSGKQRFKGGICLFSLCVKGFCCCCLDLHLKIIWWLWVQKCSLLNTDEFYSWVLLIPCLWSWSSVIHHNLAFHRLVFVDYFPSKVKLPCEQTGTVLDSTSVSRGKMRFSLWCAAIAKTTDSP